MLIKPQRPWNLSENDLTPESVYLDRRKILAQMGLGSVALGASMMPRPASAFFWGSGKDLDPFEVNSSIEGFPAATNADFTMDSLGRPLTDSEDAVTYTNFYEFGSSKNIWRSARQLQPDPWKVTITGMVEEKITIDAADLIKQIGPQEERYYRFRCVETWAMAVPWTGVPMAKLVEFARPNAGAKYVVFKTFVDANMAPGQNQHWYPWPYTEGLTLEEATNELTLLVTGIYGKPLPKQNGAPIRLIVPWKFGFKSAKSINRIEFTDERPTGFWERLQPREYGFWANVNPEVPHVRWSQASEKMLGETERRPTLRYNGYGEWVEALYKDLPQERELFF